MIEQAALRYDSLELTVSLRCPLISSAPGRGAGSPEHLREEPVVSPDLGGESMCECAFVRLCKDSIEDGWCGSVSRVLANVYKARIPSSASY